MLLNTSLVWLRQQNLLRAAVYALLAALLATALYWRFRAIENGMPYPQHVDEFYLSEKAAAILETGDWNPHFFMYPGLPIYLTAGAMTYGYLDAANHLELRNTAEIGSVGYPYYEHPRVVRPARRLFALISILGMAALALLARDLAGREPGPAGLAALLLAPAWLALSSLYFDQSQNYLNVNILGSAAAWVTILLVVRWLPRRDWLAKAIWPGVLAGLVAACKYNFATIVLAPLLALHFYGEKGKRAGQACAMAAVLGTTFLVCAPYTLLDFKTFLDDLALITHIYRGGYFGHPESAAFGSHLLLTLREIQHDFGAGGTLFVLAGALWLFRRQPRRALVVTIFPVVLLLQMCSVPTHLMRNLVPFLPFWALCGALGLVAAAQWASAALASRKTRDRLPSLGRLPAPARAALALALLLMPALFFLPLRAPADWLATPLDSRQRATSWLIENAPKDRPLLVPSELGLHPGPFAEAGIPLKMLAWRSLTIPALLAELAENPDSLVLAPSMNSLHWDREVTEKGWQLVPRMDSLLAEIEPLQIFGSHKVSVNFDAPPGGDPLFAVGRPRRSVAELEQMAGGLLLLPRDFSGEKVQQQAPGLAILEQEPVASREIELPAGAYRLSIDSLGSPAKDRYPVLRVRFGDLYLGRYVAGDGAELQNFDFVVEAPQRAELVFELINDEVERDAQGRIVADRNAWLRGAFLARQAPPEEKAPPRAERAALSAAPVDSQRAPS